MKRLLFDKAIERRRKVFPECEYLSDWQVHSAHLAAGAVNFVAGGIVQGPVYLPMPTGSGKTTGAIWGIVEFVEKYPDQRICFMTPYQESVERVYEHLTNYLGEKVVGYYHSNSLMDKTVALEKQVLIITHAFVEHNQGRLDDRDIFVIDEAIYATGEAQLKLEHFGAIRSWATRNAIMSSEFEQLYDLVVDLDRKLRNEDKQYIAVPKELDISWARRIAYDLKYEDYPQTIDDLNLFNASQRFCEALLEGLVFLSKGRKGKKRYDPIYSAAVLGIPRIDKTVILSATGGMIYDIAGPFQQYSGVRDYWHSPDYKNFKLVQLVGPELPEYYSSWSSQNIRDKVVSYIDWLIKEIPQQEIYLTIPKKVLIGCLMDYFNVPRQGEISYPVSVIKHEKSLRVSHHARSIGTNEFKDCDAVIYLWDNYLPQHTSVQRFHTLENVAITDEALEAANSGQLIGNYKRIKEAQFIDNMMQQIGRGNIRNIDAKALAGKMTAYVLTTRPERFVRLGAQYRGCQKDHMIFEQREVKKVIGRIAQVVEFLSDYEPKEDIPAPLVEEALKFDLRRYSKELSDNWDVMQTGYQYVPGGKGRGKSATFRWSG